MKNEILLLALLAFAWAFVIFFFTDTFGPKETRVIYVNEPTGDCTGIAPSNEPNTVYFTCK